MTFVRIPKLWRTWTKRPMNPRAQKAAMMNRRRELDAELRFAQKTGGPYLLIAEKLARLDKEIDDFDMRMLQDFIWKQQP